MIRFACVWCERTIEVPEEKAGERLGCPSCRKAVQVPGGSALIQANCPPLAVARPPSRVESLTMEIRKTPFYRQRVFLGCAAAAVIFAGLVVFSSVVLFVSFRPHPAGSGAKALSASKPASANSDVNDARPADRKDREAIVELCAPSVARIRFRIGQNVKGGGSGFMIRPGVLVTNAHVIEGALPEDLEVYFPSAKGVAKTSFPCQILRFEPKRDIAFLSVAPKVPPLRLADSFRFRSGKEITLIGSPLAAGNHLENVVTAGTLSTEPAANAMPNRMPFYQFSAAINGGHSGGPVFDDRGQVIGMVTLRGSRGGLESIGYCIPWKDLKERVDALEKEPAEKALAAAQSSHRLAVFIRHTTLCAKVYSNSAVLAGAREQIENARRGLGRAILDANRRRQAGQLLQDANLSAAVRGHFGKLLAVHDELQQLSEMPDKDVNDYEKKKQQLTARFQAQLAALYQSLDLDPAETD